MEHKSTLDSRRFPFLFKFIANAPQIGETEEEKKGVNPDGETYNFPVDGREEYVEAMKAAGYVEQPEFEGKVTETGYWCANCEYFIKKKDSPTGFWCKKYNFPDKPHGCSAGWEWEEDKLLK